jgi:hypothetical protein
MLASPMSNLSIPPAAVRADLPPSLRLQIVTPAANPPTATAGCTRSSTMATG